MCMCIDLSLPLSTNCVMGQILPYPRCHNLISVSENPSSIHSCSGLFLLISISKPQVFLKIEYHMLDIFVHSLTRLMCVGFCYCFYSRFLSWHIIAEVSECCAQAQIFLPWTRACGNLPSCIAWSFCWNVYVFNNWTDCTCQLVSPKRILQKVCIRAVSAIFQCPPAS